jgi:hypothetical protein
LLKFPKLQFPRIKFDPTFSCSPLPSPHCSAARFTPVFVFPGLTAPRKEKPSISADAKAEKREQAWTAYEQGRIAEATSLFLESDKFIAQNYQQNVMRYLYDKRAEFVRAPYSQHAQLAYFLNPSRTSPQAPAPTPVVHAVFGSLDMLMYGVSKVITSIDVVNGVFRWVDFGSLLDDVKLSPDQFVDACIFAGLDFCSTIPALNPSGRERFSFRAAVDMIATHGSGVAAITALQPTVPALEKIGYRDQFLRAKTTIAHHIIFDATGSCEPRNRDTVPADLHEVVGPRIPDDLMWLISQGSIGTQLVASLLSGGYLDLHPLVDSEELQQLIVSLAPLRTRTFALLTFSLAEPFRRKHMVAINYFDASNESSIAHFEEHAEVASLRCMVSDDEIAAEAARQGNSRRVDITINFVLKMQLHKLAVGGPLLSKIQNLPSDGPDVVTSRLTMVAAIYLQALETREFVTPVTRQPTIWGRALGSIAGPFDEEAWVFLELLRSKLLHGRALVPVVGAAHPNEQEVALLSRVFSLLPLKTTQKAWSGPVDHDLVAFNSIVRVMYRSLRNLEEMLLTNLILTRRSTCEPTEYTYYAHKMPFSQEANSLLGVVLKSFFSPEQDFATVLENCVDARIALDRGVMFWEQVMRMVSILNAEGAIDADTFELFESADDLLQSNKVALTTM